MMGHKKFLCLCWKSLPNWKEEIAQIVAVKSFGFMAKYTKYIQFPFCLRVVKKGLIDKSSPQQNLKIINWVLFLPISQPTILWLLFGIFWLQNVSRNLVKKSIQIAYEWRVGSFLCPRVNTSYSFTVFFASFCLVQCSK